MSDCDHPWVCDGPRIPLRWGSAATEICGECCMWRTLHHGPGVWLPAKELALEYVDPEEARPPTPSAQTEQEPSA